MLGKVSVKWGGEDEFSLFLKFSLDMRLIMRGKSRRFEGEKCAVPPDLLHVLVRVSPPPGRRSPWPVNEPLCENGFDFNGSTVR